ncbi:MAG: DUF4388 domain-containing protein [Pseudomonadota bacterium]
MSAFKALFQIVENKNCPLYNLGEELQLTDKALLPPRNKAVCLILAREMTELLFSLLSQGAKGLISDKIFSCSGCSGLIKFKMNANQRPGDEDAAAAIAQIIGSDLSLHRKLTEGIETIDLFQILEKENLAEILPHFNYKKFAKGDEILRKGEKDGEVVFILSGKVAVLDGIQTIAVLGRGEILGEMSQLTAQPVSATVQTIEATEALCISGNDMRKVMDTNPSLNIYFLRLLAKRLTRSNAARLQEIALAMSGTLDEMPQVELFQIFHMNAKTGVLTIEMSKGEARIAFREGNLIDAVYGEAVSGEAIYQVIAEKSGGRFRFSAGLSSQEMNAPEIGDFMKILMDALRRIDEESYDITEEDEP